LICIYYSFVLLQNADRKIQRASECVCRRRKLCGAPPRQPKLHGAIIKCVGGAAPGSNLLSVFVNAMARKIIVHQ